MPERTTRDHLLHVARELFTAKGFPNASVAEVCQQAGVSAPTLYYHFGSKDGLFQAVVEETLDLTSFHKLLRRAVAVSADPQAKLRAFVLAYLTHFPTQLLNPGLHLQDSTELNGTSLLRLQSGIAGIYHVARELIQEGVAEGAFREVELDYAASCLVGTVDSFVRGRVYLGIEYEPEEVTEAVVDLFAHGLVAGAGGEGGRL